MSGTSDPKEPSIEEINAKLDEAAEINDAAEQAGIDPKDLSDSMTLDDSMISDEAETEEQKISRLKKEEDDRKREEQKRKEEELRNKKEEFENKLEQFNTLLSGNPDQLVAAFIYLRNSFRELVTILASLSIPDVQYRSIFENSVSDLNNSINEYVRSRLSSRDINSLRDLRVNFNSWRSQMGSALVTDHSGAIENRIEVLEEEDFQKTEKATIDGLIRSFSTSDISFIQRKISEYRNHQRNNVHNQGFIESRIKDLQVAVYRKLKSELASTSSVSAIETAIHNAFNSDVLNEDQYNELKAEINAKKKDEDKQRFIREINTSLSAGDTDKAEDAYVLAMAAQVDANTLTELKARIDAKRAELRAKKETAKSDVESELMSQLEAGLITLDQFNARVDNYLANNNISSTEAALIKKNGLEKWRAMTESLRNNTEFNDFRDELYRLVDSPDRRGYTEAMTLLDKNDRLTEVEKENLRELVVERDKRIVEVIGKGDFLRNARPDRFSELRYAIERAHDGGYLSSEISDAFTDELYALRDQREADEKSAEKMINIEKTKKFEENFVRFKKVLLLSGGILAFTAAGAGMGALLGGLGIVGAGAGTGAGWAFLGGSAAGAVGGGYKLFFGGGLSSLQSADLEIIKHDREIARIRKDLAAGRINIASGEVKFMARLYAAETGRDPEEMIKIWTRQFGVADAEELEKALSQMAGKEITGRNKSEK